MILYLYPLIGAFLIGLSKAGFATGLGILITPLLATAFPAREAIGIVLPMLCFADMITITLYWKKWDFTLVRDVIIGAIPGILVGMFFINLISDRFLKVSIGILGLFFLCLLVFLNIWHQEKVFKPSLVVALLTGCLAGFTSTVSHAAGPIIAIFLLVQKPPKEVFVASCAIYFTIGNLMKVPPYIAAGILNKSVLLTALIFIPVIPLGSFIGRFANRRMSQKFFNYLVYFLLSIASLKLILQ